MTRSGAFASVVTDAGAAGVRDAHRPEALAAFEGRLLAPFTRVDGRWAGTSA